MGERTSLGDERARLDGAPGDDFRALFEATPGINLVLAPDAPRFTMLAASDERLAATVTTRDGTIGRPLFEVFSDDNPENPEPSGVSNLRLSLEAVLRTRAAHRMAVQRYDLRRPDGSWEVRHWSPRNLPVLGPDGAVRYILHHVEDVTEAVERAAAHARLQGEYAESEESRRALEEANALLQEQQIELELANHQLQEQATELEFQAETLQGAAEELVERTAAAERANRAKTDFLAVMSHELRTPLNAIQGHVQLLEMELHGPLTPPQREALGRIQRSQRHLLGLINDVLNFAKLEAGHVEYALADVLVCDVIDGVEPLVAPQLRARALHFDRVACTERCVARADADKVRQVLLNLLSNAAKFTAAGGTVTLRCRTRATAVVVSVEDTGIGIAADRLGDVFDPFVQIDRRLNSPHEGTGLGLAISRDLARGMGGDLTAESTPGVGSIFTLTLPLGDATAS